jgi:cytochrome bd-type quinol oxidase subunit 2
MKKYFLIVISCFLGTQIPGLILGTSYAIINFDSPHINGFELAKYFPESLMIGTLITIIPSLTYALIMSFFILKNRERSRSKWLDFATSASLVIAVFFLTLIIRGKFHLTNDTLELLMIALGSSSIGVAITHLYLNKNRKNMHKSGKGE